MDLDFTANGDIRELSAEEVWETIVNFSQGQQEWDNLMNLITEQELASLRAQAKELFGNQKILVEMLRCIAWDKMDNPSPQSTPQVLPSFEEYTMSVTYLKDVEETIGILMEVEPLDHTKLEDLGLNTCSHDLYLSSRKVPTFGKHWKEIHVTWAQLEKKHDKNATLQDFDGAWDLQCVETASRFLLTPSKLEGDDVTIICDDVTVADLKKLIEDSTG
ncbi:hypothetical protein Tco_0446749 [Tanacetum coccineum]